MRPVLTLLWWEADFEGEGDLVFALHVARQSFPDLYIQAVEAIRQGATEADLDRLICSEITRRGIPIDDLEWIGFGIPMLAYGVALDDPDFYTTHPEAIPVLACFGLSPEPNAHRVEAPERAYTAGRLIAQSLEQQPDPVYRQLSWLIQWLFSCSGNSIIDYDEEAMGEFQPLSWDRDDVAFAIDIIEEADRILQEALAGLAVFQAQPLIRQALQANIDRIYRTMKKKEPKHHDRFHIRLEWPPVDGGLAGAAQPVA